VQVGGTVDHIQYDTISYSGLTNANAKSFGKRVVPSYDLSKADVIVGVDCDFPQQLGQHHGEHLAVRHPPQAEGGGMSKHFQFEALMSLTGANADERTAVKVSQLPTIVASLHDHVAGKLGGTKCGAGDADCDAATMKAADALVAARGKAWCSAVAMTKACRRS
jgi:molybdopterin-containing oxidoreductase family iron-sulfur binding subunit